MMDIARPSTLHPLGDGAIRDDRLLTAKDAAHFLRCSSSWLAKARMRGDGPPYLKVGRSVRYAERELGRWLRSQQYHSTSERHR
jgi:predicted DNA-binding transcriptional regulator AlpA